MLGASGMYLSLRRIQGNFFAMYGVCCVWLGRVVFGLCLSMVAPVGLGERNKLDDFVNDSVSCSLQE